MAAVAERPAERPDGFDLSREWADTVSDVERHRSTVSATARIDARFLPVLRKQFGRHCTVLDDDPAPATAPPGDARPRVRVSAPTATSVAEQLAGWGARVEVEGPDAVRAELARIGAELVASCAADRGIDC